MKKEKRIINLGEEFKENKKNGTRRILQRI